ncbi:MAG TPA: sulfite exporter TauE/SafE family protein [Acidimicrobiia bacterium]|jgi:uncharacterized membrane protein YfcA|nr:sulfite exporter TauE/SafE family protein [Acidimicrobiia bacterium]
MQTVERSEDLVTSGRIEIVRRFAYPAALAVVYVTWLTYMVATNSWHFFAEHWPVSLTMSVGSFVAGATAEGGAAVAFPVFTKALQIEPSTAATFGLMIQAVGMTMAGLVIWVRRVPILPKVIGWVTLGGVFGQILGTFWLSVGSPYSKILFTFVATVFGVALAISRWVLKWQPLNRVPIWGGRSRTTFVAIGVIGGTFAANTGSGIDMLTFIVLTLALGINEKVSTPSTVIIMGFNSVVGFALHLFIKQDIGIAFEYWMVAVPIVILGAPLGAYFASKAKRDHIISLLLFLIGLELVTTLILVPFSPTAITVTLVAVGVCVVWFVSMLHFREQVIRTYADRDARRAMAESR